jgi:DNA-binding protein HU-beta
MHLCDGGQHVPVSRRHRPRLLDFLNRLLLATVLKQKARVLHVDEGLVSGVSKRAAKGRFRVRRGSLGREHLGQSKLVTGVVLVGLGRSPRVNQHECAEDGDTRDHLGRISHRQTHQPARRAALRRPSNPTAANVSTGCSPTRSSLGPFIDSFRGHCYTPPRFGAVMIKADIVNRVAEAVDLPRVKAADAVSAVLRTMKEALLDERRIELRGFGVFEVRDRKRGIGRNPKTGVEVEITPGKTVRFKPGKRLREI